ncbi:hypothetical protein BJ875DRAFT_221903 [Amylocarpus encephaloides]|uniref:Zn(2)-C6 fungal-type domain-containing protein n=1 Tax=Amylocarpus encephaloides TaxID=45428 RepID=A0A9P8CAA7_9HELO|nr:hypothetical protein BJ875DRAFT_221903 [Amylocarpus encephaloides]
MRSRTGCQTCRSRKLKCDESKPICGQCRKGSRECQPSDGVVFRHQQNASMNGTGEEDDGSGRKLGGFYAYRNTFNEDTVWVEVPKNVTFLNIVDPFNMEPTPEPGLQNTATPVVVPRMSERPANPYYNVNFDEAPGLEALSAAATGSLQYLRPLPVAEQPPAHSSNNLNFILNPAGPERPNSVVSSPPIDPSIVPSNPTSPPTLEATAVDEHEVAFLLRHFGETTGQW